jgi:predicted metal-binding protein
VLDISSHNASIALVYNSTSYGCMEGVKMNANTKIGIIICDRYRRCAGGKCLRALKNRDGAFSVYTDREVELVGYTTCDGCPGGNIEYAGDEMKKYGVEVIHLATGFIVGYPPCPYISAFTKFLEARYDVKVVVGTHPIPQKYLEMHASLRTWEDPTWGQLIGPSTSDEATRIAYN